MSSRMPLKLRNSGLFFLFSCLFFTFGQDAKAENLLIDRQYFECFVESIDEYIRVGRNPVLVYFEFCPETQPGAIGFSENNYPIVKAEDGGDIVLVWPFTVSELVCIKKMGAEIIANSEGSHIELFEGFCEN